MSSGLSVICTNVGANPELVAHGVTGQVIPAGDDSALVSALRRYIDYPEYRREHSRAAIQFAQENFSLPMMVEKYIELYLSPRPQR